MTCPRSLSPYGQNQHPKTRPHSGTQIPLNKYHGAPTVCKEPWEFQRLIISQANWDVIKGFSANSELRERNPIIVWSKREYYPSQRLLSTRPWATPFACITLLLCIITPLYKWGNWGPEHLSDLLKVPQPGSDGAGLLNSDRKNLVLSGLDLVCWQNFWEHRRY